MEWRRVPKLVLFLAFLHIEFCESTNQSTKQESEQLRGPTITKKRNFYDLTAKDIDGNPKRFEEFRGQVLLVVNVASECGFTDSHYKALVRLQTLYGATGKFSVIGIPCNDFGAQEPGSEKEIKEFATTKYNVNFPLFSKVSITGQPPSALYKFLAEATGKEPNWNFWKYLLSHDGDVLNAWGPWIDVEAITQELRTAVNAAVMADPNKPSQRASGPPQPKQKDYGDGAHGRGSEPFGEGGRPSVNKESGKDEPQEPSGEGGRPSVNHRPAGNDEPQMAGVSGPPQPKEKSNQRQAGKDESQPAGATLVHEDL